MKKAVILMAVLVITMTAVGLISFLPQEFFDGAEKSTAEVTFVGKVEEVPEEEVVVISEIEEVLENLPRTLEDINPGQWLSKFFEALNAAKADGQTWVDDFKIENGKLVFRNASMPSSDYERVRSSIEEQRRPAAVISNAVEYAMPKEIGVNEKYGRLYLCCTILSNPVMALQVADYLNDAEFYGKPLGDNIVWLRDYVKYMNKAYANVNRGDLTGQIYQNWLEAKVAPRGLEVAIDPELKYVSNEKDLKTGRIDQLTISIGLCELLDEMTQGFVSKKKADWFYELLPSDASLRRAVKCNASEAGDWFRCMFMDPKSGRIMLTVMFNTADLRIGHPAKEENDDTTRTPVVTTTTTNPPVPEDKFVTTTTTTKPPVVVVTTTTTTTTSKPKKYYTLWKLEDGTVLRDWTEGLHPDKDGNDFPKYKFVKYYYTKKGNCVNVYRKKNTTTSVTTTTTQVVTTAPPVTTASPITTPPIITTAPITTTSPITTTPPVTTTTSDTTTTPTESGKDESFKPDEQSNAPVGGGENDDKGPGPYEPDPIVTKSSSTDVDDSQYQPVVTTTKKKDSSDDSPDNTQGHIGPSDDDIQSPDEVSVSVEVTENDDGSVSVVKTIVAGEIEENGGHTQDVITEDTTIDQNGNETKTLEQIDNENIAGRVVEGDPNEEAGSADQNTGDLGFDMDF